ncbi:unnamed protein product [Bursaphelenchus xylophilus]|uniref:(pine wood nematode) hypothetical protein n=1 Tax=Bursaphelenchus xylophilus TaxID=6326 RepID=A0A1I7SQM5_BURXY|nr:unnamed protein product [Bursaphelenchus xylophilus]CAG9110107.1 unnamed protein product [Bursaphelenchus xylophilus]
MFRDMTGKDKPNRLKQWHIVALSAIIISIIVFVASLGILIGLPSMVEKNIREASSLTKGSDLLDKWMKPNYKIKRKISTFSVKNPDAVVNGSRPILTKKGPYVFDERQRREVLSSGNGTIKFKTYHTYFFNEGDSCPECYLHNRVWVPNIIFQKFVEAATKPTMKAATAALLVQTPFLEVEVSELLFDGYADPFLDQVCAIPFVNFICESILDLPERIGLLYGTNNTATGIYEVSDGYSDYGESLGKVISWNSQNILPDSWWSTEEARTINGTDGGLFRPFVSKKEPLKVFSAELCRTIELVYKEEVDHDGITAYRYVLNPAVLDYNQKKNKGFCIASGKKFYAAQNESCLPNGLLDLSRCQKGEPPIVMSMPNFLYAPDYVRDSIDGLEKPDPDRDEIEVDLEPRLGAVLKARRKLQINVAMWNGRNLSMPGLDLSRFYNAIVPVIEINEDVEIDDENFRLIRQKLIGTEAAVKFAGTSGVIFSLVAGVMVVIYIGHRTGRIRKVVRQVTIRQQTVRQAKDTEYPPKVVEQSTI